MEVMVGRCCGLDVHQASVVACALLYEGGRKPKKVIQTFRTMKSDLEQLSGWLKSLGVTHVALEGTGVYWMPVYAMLEEQFDITVANARHVKRVPGRKTDVSDAQWLADLLQHGLLRKSFVPAQDIRAIRDVSRYRRMLIHSETTEKNRTIKLLEVMGIKLACVASDVFGKSGLAMLRAIAQGTEPLETIVQMARSRLRHKMPELRLALDVTVQEHHRIMLRDQLARLDRTAEDITRYDALLAKMVEPYTEVLAQLCTIPGIQAAAAIEIFAEIGPDLSTFPDEGHFSSWVGTCPGANESGGKKGTARRRRGNPYLQSILVECALAATRKKNTYLKNKYHRLKARRGSMRALFAIAHKLARAVFRAIANNLSYLELGPEFLDALNKDKIARTLVQRLQILGFDRTTVLDLFPASTPSQITCT